MTTVVWVTGASRGIGRALAEAAVRREDDPIVVGVSRTSVDLWSVNPLSADLSTAVGWEMMATSFDAHLGVDVDRAYLLHAAGTAEPIGRVEDLDTDAFRAATMLNAAAPLVLGQRFARAVASSPAARGTLAILSTGPSVYAGWSAYKPGKAAVDAFVQTLGAEHREGSRIRALSISPGPVDTDMQTAVRNADPEGFPNVGKFRELHATDALPSPEWAAEAIWRAIDSDAPSGSVLDVRSG